MSGQTQSVSSASTIRYLASPRNPLKRLAGLVFALIPAMFLASTLLIGNALQLLTLIVLPFSPGAFRALNRFLADTWWGWCVIATRGAGVQVIISGDELPMRENAIVISNHQEMPDIIALMVLARLKGRLGDMKWFVKDEIKWVPGIGWGLLFLGALFVKRAWSSDRASIEKTFGRVLRNKIPLWLLTFPEGTRITPAKLERSRTYAIRHRQRPCEHVLLPRVKGFLASVAGLRSHATAVYDVTIGYPDGIPTLAQFVQRQVPRVHLDVRRFPVDELPADDEALGRWLLQRFAVKDEMLSRFQRDGRFAGP